MPKTSAITSIPHGMAFEFGAIWRIRHFELEDPIYLACGLPGNFGDWSNCPPPCFDTELLHICIAKSLLRKGGEVVFVRWYWG